MKAKKPHVVPLTDQAIKILEAQRDQHSRWIFPSQRKETHLSNMAMAMLLRDLAPGYTVHGFRSTFRVWGAEETNHPSAVMEMALAHVIPNTTEAAYQRSDLREKRKSLMADWDTFISSGASDGKN
jgi:integrase